MGGFSGLCTWFLYTRTRMAFRSGCVCGAGGTACSWDPLPLGSGVWGAPPPRRQGRQPTPSLGTVPIWRKPYRGPGPRRAPCPGPCPQPGVAGEVAHRFPGQHRGRLGWSSGRQRRGWVSPSPPRPHSPSLHPLVLRISPAPLSSPPAEAWPVPAAAAALGGPGQAARDEGLAPAASCPLPPGGPLCRPRPDPSFKARLEEVPRCPLLLCIHPSSSFHVSVLAAPTS